MARLRDDQLDSGIGVALSRRQDEFSVQYTLQTDTRFWIRVALPVTRPVVFTDFFPGSLDALTCADALDAVLRDLKVASVHLEFARLGEAGTEAADRNIAWLGRVIDAYVVRSRQFVRLRTVSVDRGEANLRVILWDGPEAAVQDLR